MILSNPFGSQATAQRQNASLQKSALEKAKTDNKYRLLSLKEERKIEQQIQEVEEDYATGDTSGSALDKGRARKELAQVRTNHLLGAIASWLISNAYWMKIVFMGASVLTAYRLPDWQVWLIVTSGTVGSLALVTVIERTKYTAQMDNRVTLWSLINITVVGISIITSVGSLMDTQQGAEKLRASMSAESINASTTSEGYAKTWNEYKWIRSEAINSPDGLAKEMADFLASPALNSGGRPMANTNDYILNGAGRGVNYQSALTKKKVIDNKIAARREFDSVKDLVNPDGTPKVFSGGAGNNEDALAGAIAKMLKVFGDFQAATILMFISFFVIIGLEVVGYYNGSRRIRLQMIVDGLTQKITEMEIAGAVGVSINAVRGMFQSLDTVGSALALAPALAPAVSGGGDSNQGRSSGGVPSAAPNISELTHDQLLERKNDRSSCRTCQGELPYPQSTYCCQSHGNLFRRALGRFSAPS